MSSMKKDSWLWMPAPAPSDHNWYVVYCKPNQERQVALLLEQRFGLCSYIPELRYSIRSQLQSALLFPCYVFIQADLQQLALSSINGLPGVVRLVTFGDIPPTISASMISALRQQVACWNAHDGTLDHGYTPGEQVRLRDGPLQGLAAVFLEPANAYRRMRILIDFLGQLRPTEVNLEQLEHAYSATPPKRERRTRGRGRPINQH